MLKLASWNVNGIRAATKHGFLEWLERSEADVVGIQESKANPDQLDLFQKSPSGYQSFWHSAEKAGYSGVGIYTRIEPENVIEGMGAKEFDREGRVIQAEFKDFVLVNAYFPNSQREGARLDYKLRFCSQMLKLCKKWVKKGKNVVLCGDYNIAHKEIDLKNPKSNVKNAGFLPEERAWMDQFTDSGFVDSFREFEPGPDHYTWWSYRGNVRERNIGWRIDYHCVNQEFQDRVKAAYHEPHIKGSDHCPVRMELYQ